MTAAAQVPSSEDTHVHIAIEGALALVTFDRPRALNALTTAMRARLAECLPVFARNPLVYATVLQSASPKAFSAGADVREMIQWGRERPEAARRAFGDEYSLNWLLECYSKPSISLIDGLCMGSGVGVSIFNTHRVAGENYRFAMPENAIGFFPDVGVAHVLSRLPGEAGLYLGLTGRAIGRADAYRLGLVTHCVPAARFGEIKDGLRDAQPVDPLLDGRHEDPGAGELDPYAGTIARCFSAGTVEEIVARLAAVSGPDRDWAQGVLADLAARSPTSLKVAFRHIRESARRDLRATLQIDYRVACRFLETHDFYEGVRAALIDKDGKPDWRPPALADVTDALVDTYFAPPKDGDLVLPSREEMQAARV